MTAFENSEMIMFENMLRKANKLIKINSLRVVLCAIIENWRQEVN